MTYRNNRPLLLAALAIAAALTLGWFLFGGAGDRATFLSAPIITGKLHQNVTVTGSVMPSVSVDVSSQLSGRIDEVLADFNQQIEAGQPLARLDQQSYRAEVNKAEAALAVAKSQILGEEANIQRSRRALASVNAELEVHEANIARAEAELRLAQSSLKRKSGLVKSGGITADALDEAQALAERAKADLRGARATRAMHGEAIEMAQAELVGAESELANALARIPQVEAVLEGARVNLEKTVIRSPIDGIVIRRDIAEGQTVAASLEAPKLFTIAGDLGQIAVYARVDEADIGRVKFGQKVSFTVDAFPGQLFSGDVSQVRKSPDIIQNVVTYTVVIAAPNPDLVLLPGMTALVEITVVESGELVLIPNAALRFRPQPEDLETPGDDSADAASGTGPAVWIAQRSGKLSPVEVITGASDASFTELAEGPLEPGQQVVTRRIAASGQRTSTGLRLGF